MAACFCTGACKRTGKCGVDGNEFMINEPAPKLKELTMRVILGKDYAPHVKIGRKLVPLLIPAGAYPPGSFDRERMEEALASPSTLIPSGLSREELRDFISNSIKDDKPRGYRHTGMDHF